MHILDYPLLTDENIHSDVVTYLRKKGFDVLDIKEEALQGKKDSEILAIAYEQKRVVITHDSDFGLLTIMKGQPFIGIIFIRPGDIQTLRTINQLEKFINAKIILKPQFMIVIQRDKIRIRILEEE